MHYFVCQCSKHSKVFEGNNVYDCLESRKYSNSTEKIKYLQEQYKDMDDETSSY